MTPPDTKQVEAGHYAFARYMSAPRWASLWHQLDTVLRLQPRRVLEVGPGPGVFKRVAAQFGVAVETLDLDPELKPDHIGSATALPFDDGAFDLVCAFQMLEHLPYEQSLRAFEQMLRVARRHVVLSLPDARTMWRFSFHVPRRGSVDWLLPKPSVGLRPHVFDGEHHWELNTQQHPLAQVVADLSARCRLDRTWRVPELAYHRFFVFDKQASSR
jgi:SAM-dependent methyltransferase